MTTMQVRLTLLLYCQPRGELTPVEKQTFHSFLHFQNMFSFWRWQMISPVFFQLPVTHTRHLRILITFPLIMNCLSPTNQWVFEWRIILAKKSQKCYPKPEYAGRMSGWISLCTVFITERYPEQRRWRRSEHSKKAQPKPNLWPQGRRTSGLQSICRPLAVW